jgi:hypothetical protein
MCCGENIGILENGDKNRMLELKSGVIDRFLLSAIYPTRENQEQKLSRMQNGCHISPNAVSKAAASEICRLLSSVYKTIHPNFGKRCYFTYFSNSSVY